MRLGCRKTKDPWKTTRLIGRGCKGSNAFSRAVRTVEGLTTPTGRRECVQCTLPRRRPSAGHNGSRFFGVLSFLGRTFSKSSVVRTSLYVRAARKGRPFFVGDHSQRVTPVPVPITVVKPLGPMIVHRAKVGRRRLYDPAEVTLGGVFLFLPRHRPFRAASLGAHFTGTSAGPSRNSRTGG
jgi:hypothetical protein